MQQTANDMAAGAAGATGFLEQIRRAVDVLRLRADAVDAVTADRSATPGALLIVALAGVAAASDAGLFLPAYVGMAVLYVVVSLAVAGILHLGATQVLGARGEFLAFYRAFAQSYLLLWLVGVPIVQAFLLWALWAWQVAVTCYCAERVYRLARVRAVGLVVVPLFAVLLTIGLLSSFLALFALVTGWIL
jgi:hypothetical protein